MIIRHSKEQVSEYYTKPGLNQSALKILINEGIQKFLEDYQDIKDEDLYYSEKDYFIRGQSVDTYFSHGEEVFESTYYVSRLVKKPSDTIMSIVRQIFDTAKQQFTTLNPDSIFRGDIDEEVLDPIIIEAIEAHAYQSNWKLDTKINKIRSEGKLYWEELISSDGMQILSEEESTLIYSIIKSLKEHPNTKDLFVDNEDEDVIYQLPLYFTYEGVDCKSLLDLVRVNHKTKIIKPWDIKTLYDYIVNIHRSIRSRRYDFQGAYYMQALHYPKSKEIISELLDKDVTDYEIDLFGIIGQSTKVVDVPLAVNLSLELLTVGKHGNDKIKGFHQAIEEYKFWEERGFDLNSLITTDDKVQGLIDKDFNLLFGRTAS